MTEAVKLLKDLSIDQPNILADSDKKNIKSQADGRQTPVRYVNKESKKKAINFIDRWTAFNTYKLAYMNNRTSNRVEVESEEFFEIIRPLFSKVYSFAVYNVFNELAESRSSVEPISYKACLCSVRLQYNLPCKHILSLAKGSVPLSMISRKWRFDYFEGEDDYSESKFSNQNDKDALKESEEESDILRNNDDSEDATEAVEEETKAVRLVEKKVERLQDEENRRGLTIRMRKASATKYGKEDFVFDKHFKAHKRTPKFCYQKTRTIGYLNPKPDGNCGFRAITFSVETSSRACHDEDQYLEVKSKMLITFLHYKEIYTKNVPAFQIHRLVKVMEKGMSKSDLAEWVCSLNCAQLIANVYSISMCVYPSLDNEHPAVKPPLTFLPLKIPTTKSELVTVHLRNSHNMHRYAIKLVVIQTNVSFVYHYYFAIKEKLDEYTNYWNRWCQFQKRRKVLLL
ncbi:hypothetical protein EDC96DRAFT_550437 [Choanephora cucurbitarum]|nr:hypothetical protein EDC96DRAFT_550437 [Choanephora cucurbitarum]